MYRTKDLSQAAYLMTRGYQIQVVSEGDHCSFEFPSEAEKDATEYNRGAACTARIYAQMLRNLKGMGTELKYSASA
jgi:hypothetical protein